MCFKDYLHARSVPAAEAGFVSARALEPSAPTIPLQEFSYRSKP
jgi:hypothetical protein